MNDFNKKLDRIFTEESFRIPMREKQKHKKLNPKTNRMKNFKKTRYLDTEVPPEKRTFKNLPRYADGRPKVTFQQWLMIKTEPHEHASIGKSQADGKWYGWSHRAVHGFKIGDKIEGDNLAKKEGEKDYTIETEEQAKQAAINFSDGVS